jgi:hypothetical protein
MTTRIGRIFFKIQSDLTRHATFGLHTGVGTYCVCIGPGKTRSFANLPLPLLFPRRAKDARLLLHPSVPPFYGDVFARCGPELPPS